MTRDLFRRYVWLVDVIRHARKISYDKIADLWLKSNQNPERVPLALRTFHNHRDAIAHLFGIRIYCDRGDRNQYYIPDEPGGITRLKVWMLQTLSMSHLVGTTGNVENRIIIEGDPEEKHGLISIIEAMNDSEVLHISWRPLGTLHEESADLAPYCVSFKDYDWLLLAKREDREELDFIPLKTITSITGTSRGFDYPSDFNPREFLSKFFGRAISVSDRNAETIKIRIGGSSRERIRMLPLHQSQEEIYEKDEYSVFEFRLVASEEFLQTVLSMGSDAEVISPVSLREQLFSTMRQMVSRYETSIPNPVGVSQMAY